MSKQEINYGTKETRDLNHILHQLKQLELLLKLLHGGDDGRLDVGLGASDAVRYNGVEVARELIEG
jgi:hypothetical protein